MLTVEMAYEPRTLRLSLLFLLAIIVYC